MLKLKKNRIVKILIFQSMLSTTFQIQAVEMLESRAPGDLVPAEAGKRGFVQVDPQSKRLVFADGTPARFYGVNFAEYFNQPEMKIPTEEMVGHLMDLKKMGVNVIRFQTYDNRIQKDVYGEGLNEIAIENRDRFIAEGKKLGIYFHMSMNTAGSGKGGAEELYRKAGGSREMLILVDELIDKQKAYAVRLLNHVNPYTGLAYKDEPAIISLQLGNEQHAYSRPQWQKWTEHKGPYAREIKAKWNRFLAEKYGDREKLAAAWGDALKEGEDPGKGTVEIADARYPTWKDKFQPNAREKDIILFADDAQSRFHQIMRNCIRDEAGDKNHLISDNGWIRGDGLIRQTAHANLDLMDLQHYWPHGNRWRLTSEEKLDVSPIKGCGINILSSMLTAREFEGVKKPAFITEYNSHKDNSRLFQVVPVHAVFTMLVGIDGETLWSYSKGDADNFFNKDHWFSLNRANADIERELMPFIVGAYLRRTSIPELIDHGVLEKVAKWDNSNPEGLSVDYDASLQQAVSTGKYENTAEGVILDFPGDKMLIDRSDVVFYTGTGAFESAALTFDPLDKNQPYFLAVFPVDGKELSQSENWRVFATMDGSAVVKQGKLKKWKAFSRAYAGTRGKNETGMLDSSSWEVRRPAGAIYFDLTSQ